MLPCLILSGHLYPTFHPGAKVELTVPVSMMASEKQKSEARDSPFAQMVGTRLPVAVCHSKQPP